MMTTVYESRLESQAGGISDGLQAQEVFDAWDPQQSEDPKQEEDEGEGAIKGSDSAIHEGQVWTQ